MKRCLIASILCMCSLLFFSGAAPAEDTSSYTVYTVQKGDTLARIASKFFPLTAAYTKRELINSIRSVNNITRDLSVGQTLNIPVAWKEPLKPKAVPKAKDYVAKGLYMNTSNSGTRFVFESAAKLRKFGGNTIVFDAKDDMGAITYPSSLPAKYCPNEHYTPNIEDLNKLVDYLHRQGVHVVARVVVFRDPIMSKTRPDWCNGHREKAFLNPANPEVQEYVLKVVRELSDTGIDEIQLDYVRYFADVKTASGKEGMSRSDVIAGFVKRVHDITAPKGILLSLDMFGIVVWQRDVDVLTVGQDVTKLKGNVEIISPMLYPSHFSPGFGGVKNPADDPYRFVYNGIKRMKELVGDDVIIRPWLQSFPLKITRGFNSNYIQTQMDATKDSGGTGWLLWSPGNHYKEAYLAMEDIQKGKTLKHAVPDDLPREKPGKGKQETQEAGIEAKAKDSKQPQLDTKPGSKSPRETQPQANPALQQPSTARQPSGIGSVPPARPVKNAVRAQANRG